MQRQIAPFTLTLLRRSTPFLIALILVVVIYPELIVFKKFVMGGRGWELKDSVVSQLTFIPGFKVFQYAWNHSLSPLWSSLRSFGISILADGIQSAPLFPLTLLLLKLPEPYFWNTLALLRLLLTSVAAYFIAFEILRFKKYSAWVFSFCFSFALYNLRWMNHPWQNGLLASLWYLFFLVKVPRWAMTPNSRARTWGCLGLSLSVYSLLTCGFPEASVLGAFLVLLVCPFYLIPDLVQGRSRFQTIWKDYLWCHFIGATLSSSQILAFLELKSLAGPGFREGTGLHQIPLNGDYFLSKVTLFGQSGDLSGVNPHIFGFIALVLACFGFWAVGRSLSRDKKIRMGDVAAISCLAFFFAKIFPIWPWFNQLVGSLPILKECWFSVYFFPIFLWTTSHLSARGFEFLFEHENEGSFWRYSKIYGIGISLLWVTVAASFIFARQIPLLAILAANRGSLTKVLILFLFFNICLFIYLNRAEGKSFRMGGKNRDLACLFFFALLVLELRIVRPNSFFTTVEYNDTFQPIPTKSEITQKVREHSVPSEDLRLRDWEDFWDGRYIDDGIATPDSGASALLPVRLQLLRTTLFDAPWKGYLPIKAPKFNYSWQLTSTHLFLVKEDSAKGDGKNDSGFKSWGRLSKGLTLYYDSSALSRAYRPSRCISANDPSASAKYIGNPAEFRLGDVAIENLSASEKIRCGNYRATIGRVPIDHDSGNKIALKSVRGPTILVLNDQYYPGWEARDLVSGKQIEIKPANVAFRALILSENRDYRIVFEYEPTWGKLAVILTSLGFLALVFLILRGGFVKRV